MVVERAVHSPMELGSEPSGQAAGGMYRGETRFQTAHPVLSQATALLLVPLEEVPLLARLLPPTVLWSQPLHSVVLWERWNYQPSARQAVLVDQTLNVQW